MLGIPSIDKCGCYTNCGTLPEHGLQLYIYIYYIYRAKCICDSVQCYISEVTSIAMASNYSTVIFKDLSVE